MINKQLILIGVLVLITVVAALSFFLVIEPNLPTGESETVEEETTLVEGEEQGYLDRIMIFEHVQRENIKRIDVTNSYGSYAFVRDGDNFFIENHETLAYNQEKFASLVVNTGYTLSMARITEKCDDMAEYGLDENSNPARFSITKLDDGVVHTVYVGKMVPTGAGYYCRYEGRDSVYVLDATLGNTVLADVASYVTPILSYPLERENYRSIKNFLMLKGGEEFVSITSLDEDEFDASAYMSAYKMLYPASYTVSTSFDEILYGFMNFQGTKTLDIGITDEKLEKYALTNPAYEIFYEYKEILSYIAFSEKTENNTYYVYSGLFDLIAEIDAETVAFLEWDLLKYVDRSIFAMFIDEIEEITVTGGDVSESFYLSGAGETLTVKSKTSGTFVDVYNFRQFYKSILMIKLFDYATSAPPAEELDTTATLTVKTKGGVVYEYAFYQYETRRTLYTIDGKGEFYVQSDRVEKLLRDAVRVSKGESVDAEAKN